MLFEKYIYIFAFFSKGCKPDSFEKNGSLYFANNVTKYIYMTVTTTQNKSRNHIINKKIPDTLSGWHTLQSNNQIKIKHYQVLFPDDTH